MSWKHPTSFRVQTRQKFDRVWDLVSGGETLNGAARQVGRSPAGLKADLARYPEEQENYERAKALREARKNPDQRWPIEGMDLEEFRLQVFGQETFDHQRQWAEWAEDPDASHILIVTAPDLAKTTFFRSWLLYHLAKNQKLRCAYATFAHERAIKQVGLLRRVIEDNPRLAEIAPPMKPTDNRPWAETHFMVAGRSFEGSEAEADYSLVAFGQGSQAAGSRIDLFIVDDIDGKRNLSSEERRKIYLKIKTEYETRLGRGGRMVVICNRWDPDDVAAQIMRQAEEHPGSWKVYNQPAISKFPEKDETIGEVIWPERFGLPTDYPDDNIRANGPWTKERAWEYFQRKRVYLGEREFALLYLNDVQGGLERQFSDEAIDSALDRGKTVSVGSVPSGSVVVASMDPAGDRGCATLAIAVRPDGMLQLIDATQENNLGSDGMLAKIPEFGRFSPRYFAIEGQGPWKHFVNSPMVRDACRAIRSILIPLTTGENKHNQDIGISSLVPVVAGQLIIPWATSSDQERMEPLVRQLRSYRPPEYIPSDSGAGRYINRSGANDLIMALWFAVRVIRDKQLTGQKEQRASHYTRSPYSDWSTPGHSWTVPTRT